MKNLAPVKLYIICLLIFLPPRQVLEFRYWDTGLPSYRHHRNLSLCVRTCNILYAICAFVNVHMATSLEIYTCVKSIKFTSNTEDQDIGSTGTEDQLLQSTPPIPPLLGLAKKAILENGGIEKRQ